MKKRRMTAAVCLLSLLYALSGGTGASAYDTVKAVIPVNCQDVSAADSHVYEICIESENNLAPVPVSDTLKIEENGTGYFELNITEPGTFVYQIYEVAGSDSNVRYDSMIYEVTLFVENTTDDALAYAIYAKEAGKDSKAEKLQFHNVLTSEGLVLTTTAPAQTTLPDYSQTTPAAVTTFSTNSTAAGSVSSTTVTTLTTSTAFTGSTDTTVLSIGSDTTSLPAENTTSSTENGNGTTDVIVTDTIPGTSDETGSTGTKPTADTVTQSSAVTTSAPGQTTVSTTDKFTGFVDTVLTGDTFPAHTVRITMLVAILVAVSAFLFKRDRNEEEDENES